MFGDKSRSRNEFTFNQVRQIKDMCDVHGIEFFASVFDEEKIEWCEELGVKRYKIASRTVVAEPELCKKVIALGKTTYISLGFWTEHELPFVEDNVQYFNCISKYPTSCLDIKDFSYNNDVIGLSDHSYGVSYALFNISKGASFIEKHFTLNKSMDGNDHIGSMDLKELKLLRKVGDELFNIKRVISDEK